MHSSCQWIWFLLSFGENLRNMAVEDRQVKKQCSLWGLCSPISLCQCGRALWLTLWSFAGSRCCYRSRRTVWGYPVVWCQDNVLVSIIWCLSSLTRSALLGNTTTANTLRSRLDIMCAITELCSTLKQKYETEKIMEITLFSFNSHIIM